jgi:hypothetical protein
LSDGRRGRRARTTERDRIGRGLSPCTCARRGNGATRCDGIVTGVLSATSNEDNG